MLPYADFPGERMELKGRVALVTGGAKRVGRAIARAAAERGAAVAITYRSSADEAEAAVREFQSLGVRACGVRCDQRRPGDVAAGVARVEEALGPVDVLVNNAAIFRKTPFERASLEDWDEHLEVNLRGPWLFARAVGPGMKARGGGVILNLIDVSVERPYRGYLPYTISKAGLAAMTEGLAAALAPEVRVNGIAPGTVMWAEGFTEAQRQAVVDRTPLGRIGSPEDVAAAAMFLIEGSDYVTGAILPVDGGRRLG
jgi:pteridine reductase